MRSIVQVGDTALRGIASEIPLESIDTTYIRSLIADMKALLEKEEYGVALAAPQVGESVRLFIVSGKAVAKRSRSTKKRGQSADAPEISGELSGEDTVYINPAVIRTSKARNDKHEGCLSVRGKWGIVSRAEKVTIRAYDEHGKKITRGASGFLAHIFQHELDHLDGVLYTDKALDLYDESTDESRLEV